MRTKIFVSLCISLLLVAPIAAFANQCTQEQKNASGVARQGVSYGVFNFLDAARGLFGGGDTWAEDLEEAQEELEACQRQADADYERRVNNINREHQECYERANKEVDRFNKDVARCRPQIEAGGAVSSVCQGLTTRREQLAGAGDRCDASTKAKLDGAKWARDHACDTQYEDQKAVCEDANSAFQTEAAGKLAELCGSAGVEFSADRQARELLRQLVESAKPKICTGDSNSGNASLTEGPEPVGGVTYYGCELPAAYTGVCEAPINAQATCFDCPDLTPLPPLVPRPKIPSTPPVTTGSSTEPVAPLPYASDATGPTTGGGQPTACVPSIAGPLTGGWGYTGGSCSDDSECPGPNARCFNGCCASNEYAPTIQTLEDFS